MAALRPIAMKWPEDLIARLEACTEKFKRDMPGMSVTRSDVVRILLERGLAAEGFPPAEQKGKKR